MAGSGAIAVRRVRRLWRYREAAQIAAITVGVALLVKTFVADAIHIPSLSMERTVRAGDFLLVNKFVYGPATPKFLPLTSIRIPRLHLPALVSPRDGDVVVFRFPRADDATVPQGELLVKRIVGVPGDRVEARDGAILVNGRPVGIPDPDRGATPLPSFGPLEVPRDAYFVLGDNLPDSYDSRAWGCVPADCLVGKAFIVYWSVGANGIRWSRIGTIVR
ncbi:MAG: signal peptidase I [Bacteroidota bacterium]